MKRRGFVFGGIAGLLAACGFVRKAAATPAVRGHRQHGTPGYLLRATFENETVDLSGNAFINCQFLNCDFVWTEPAKAFHGCYLRNCTWKGQRGLGFNLNGCGPPMHCYATHDTTAVHVTHSLN